VKSALNDFLAIAQHVNNYAIYCPVLLPLHLADTFLLTPVMNMLNILLLFLNKYPFHITRQA